MSDWKEALPEPLREAPYFKNAETVDQVIADLTGAAAHMGNSLRIPGPDATPEQVAEFREKAQERIPGLMSVPDPDAEDYTDTLRKLGLPEAADKYKVKDDCPVQGEELGALMAEAFNAGLTQSQFTKLLSAQVEKMNEANQAFQVARDTEVAALKGEWGQAYQERMDTITEFLESAPAEMKELMPTMSAEGVRWLYQQATSLEESGESKRLADGQEPALTPIECHEQASEILGRLTSMKQTDDPQLYAHLVQKRVDLMRMAQG